MRALVAGLLVTALAVTVVPLAGASTPEGAAPPKFKIMVFDLSEQPGYDVFGITAQATAKAIKKAGGPDIEVLVCTTTFDPNSSADCAREAVDEGVTAVVGVFSTHADQYMPILEDAGIPNVAPYGIGFPELTSDLSYPIAGGILSGTAGMGAILADETDVETIDVSYLDVAGGAGAFAADLVNFGLEPRGLPKPSSTPEPVGGADLTPSAQATIGKDTDGVILATVDPEFSKWLLAYRQAGGDAILAATASTVNPTNLEALGENLEGMYVSNNYKPGSLKGDPAIKQMKKELKPVSDEIEFVDPLIGTWAGVHLVADAMADATTTDAATLIATLNSDREWDLGVIPPINFSVPNPEVAANPLLAGTITRLFNIDVYYSRVKNGKIKALGSEPHNPLLP
jgi:ABC-type branched-subunit amino acid transport system substrate-binding protein